MGAQHEPIKYSKQQLKNTHPYLQKGWIVRQEKRTYLQQSFPIQEKYYNQWRSRVSKAAGYPSSQFSFLPVDMGYVPNNQECSKTGYSLVNYPEFPYLLSDEIKRRQKEKQLFKEGQLYYLLYALTAVKIDAKQQGGVVGDIKPQNVFISRDQNIKIGLLESFPFESTNYAKFTSPTQPSYNVLLAPEDMTIASQKQVDNTANAKSEVFSIGATVLSAGILSDLSQVYDYPNRSFLKEKHCAVTTQWLQYNHYSQIFKSIILNLVNLEADKRISIEQLWKFLSKYSSSIKSKDQFIVVNPPQSLEVGVSIIRSKVHLS